MDMADVLLINTPIYQAHRDPESGISVPPIGMGYIYTQLVRSGYNCQFIDAFADGLLPDEILETINRSDAEYIGLNVFSSNLGIAQSIAEGVASPRKFLLGGPAARTLLSEVRHWRPNGSITVVAGEAELALPEIIRRPALAEELSPGLSFVDVTLESPFYPADIDLPLDRSIFRNEPVHRPDLDLVESHIVASRGCLYNCAFCTAAASLNPQIRARYRTYGSLAEELEAIKTLHPETNCIRVLDDLFLRDDASIGLAIRLFTGSGLYWRSMAHINTFRASSAHWLEGMKKSGCRELFIGIESGNNETLRHIRKPFSVDAAYRTVSRIMDARIPVKCFFVLGFPGETESAARDTVALASRLSDCAGNKGVQLRISPFRFRPYHGTTLYDELVKKGRAISPISNRKDSSATGAYNAYDAVSGVYAEYDEDTLDELMREMEALDAST